MAEFCSHSIKNGWRDLWWVAKEEFMIPCDSIQGNFWKQSWAEFLAESVSYCLEDLFDIKKRANIWEQWEVLAHINLQGVYIV